MSFIFLYIVVISVFIRVYLYVCFKLSPGFYMSVYDFSLINKKGVAQSLSEFKDKVLLIVNTASKCGFTPQYDGLEAIYEKYKEQGLVIIGVPCNQFGEQEPGTNNDVQEFCRINYGVTFPGYGQSRSKR